MKSVHFGDSPYTLPHENRTQGIEVEKEGGMEVQRRGKVEGGKEVQWRGKIQGGEGRRERGSAVTLGGTGRLQSSLEYTRPTRGSDTLAGCDSPATGLAAVVQQDSLFNT